MKKEYVVRVVIPADTQGILEGRDKWGQLIEHLRYAGLVTVHRDNEDGMCFDLRCPIKSYDTRIWAEQNAQRMQSFGTNAVCAPSTERP